tara:strand:- start:868 stop:1368 length:501 start_codon:yes stop_codon:yes gene_type:complete
MRILTLEDQSFEMNELPDEVDDLRFAILDNSDPANPDYFFIPLIFLESFNSPALVLDVAGNQVKLPVDWKILIGEKEIGDLEMINLSSLNDRGFNAFSFNPLSSYKADYLPVNITDLYIDVKWFFPKLKQGQILAIPINVGEKPMCIYCAKEINRQNEVVDITKAW